MLFTYMPYIILGFDCMPNFLTIASTMHKSFVMKPNPYITDDEAVEAHELLVMSEAASFSGLLCLSMSIFKVFPKISQRVYFKKFTVFQLMVSIGLFGYYGYQLNLLSNRVPP